MKHTIAATLAVACISGAAAAQPIFEPRLAFRADHNSSGEPSIPDGGVYHWTGDSPATLSFALMMGAFSVPGATHYGLFNWQGDVTRTGADASVVAGPGNRPPFSFNPAGNGAAGPAGITNIDSMRSPLTTTFWHPDDPQPPLPAPFPQGLDAYYSIYRFNVQITDVSPRYIEISAAGLMRVVEDWLFLNPMPGEDVEWTVVPSAPLPANGAFTLAINIPAPGAAALLGACALLAARRRRA